MDHTKWVWDHYDWLSKWFGEVLKVDESEMASPFTTDCQVVVTSGYGMLDRWGIYKGEDFADLIKRHKVEVLTMLIWSRKMANRTLCSQVSTYTSGFYEQYHRLPLPLDRVRIRYFGSDKKGKRIVRTTIEPDRVVQVISDVRCEMIYE